MGRGTAALALACLLVLTGCSGDDEPPPPPEPTPDLGTPLTDLDTRRLAVSREAFCDAIPEEAIARALDGEASRASSYGPGDRVRVSRGVKDVVHEFGCVFEGPGKAEARAWLFAPPVTPAQADALVADAGRGKACARVENAPRFGRPSVATVCSTGVVAEARFAGLFGDAWLTCSVSAKSLPDEALLDRAGRWCVEVAAAAQAD